MSPETHNDIAAGLVLLPICQQGKRSQYSPVARCLNMTFHRSVMWLLWFLEKHHAQDAEWYGKVPSRVADESRDCKLRDDLELCLSSSLLYCYLAHSCYSISIRWKNEWRSLSIQPSQILFPLIPWNNPRMSSHFYMLSANKIGNTSY